jgi:GrpB-like predicted nucleotidyltransferase (UPF0157 family)
MPTPEQITHHPEPDPTEDPWVAGPPPAEEVVVVPYDPEWPRQYEALAAAIRDALGDTVLALDHVGSTSVPGLAAKPRIDIDLTVPDSTAEAAYVPALEAIGYSLVIREPSFHEHRCLTRDDPAVNLHVWSPDSPEAVRHALFREWLRAHPDDRELYARAKRDAVPGGGGVMDYNRRKQDVIREIYARAFRAAGLL